MKRIFILDDNEELLEIMSRVLRNDYDVMCSPDTDGIVSRIFAFNPHLLVLDHSIGDTNSGEILASIRKFHPNFTTPAILFSAHPQLESIAASVGADGYIDKPSDLAYIRNYISNIIGRQ